VCLLTTVQQPHHECIMLALDQVPSVQLGSFTLTIELDDLTPELREVARKELRETPDVVKPALEELKAILKGT
jgi:hypothetical protein